MGKNAIFSVFNARSIADDYNVMCFFFFFLSTYIVIKVARFLIGDNFQNSLISIFVIIRDNRHNTSSEYKY